ncbi:MAG TPA: lysophospholipid acyltransferase family protein [Dongiaceae bacterium]|nr:lysophospholipid acyltransferase family protein [Dongiaceae bacterium]
MFWNWLFRWVVVGPIIRLFFRVHVEGMENLPSQGPFIIAAGPHRTEFESLILATYLRRHWLRFYAKEEYWEAHKLLGKLMTAIGLIPVPRSAKRALLAQIEKGVATLKAGNILAIYPEATRGYDEYMHRGYPGVAHISQKAGGVMIVPVGMIGMRKLNPPGKGLHPGRATIVIGKPIRPRFVLPHPDEHVRMETVLELFTTKSLVTKISMEIARLSTAEYLDEVLPVPGS